MGRRVAVLSLIVLSCGDEFSTEQMPTPVCNEDPWICPAGQSCAVTADSLEFACLNNGDYVFGDICPLEVGSPVCGDGLFCFPVTPQSGQCTPFCSPTDASKACPPNHVCNLVTVQAGGTTVGDIYGCSPPSG